MKNILSILFILVPLFVYAQEVVFQQEQYPFPVTFYGLEPQLGFTSASSRYHHDFGDLDNDGDFDVIIGVSMAREFYCKNIGNSLEAQYEFITDQVVDPGEYSNVCPPVFVDIDNDDDLDLFTGFNNGYLVFFRNTGTPDTAIYELETNDYLGVVLAGGCPSHDFVDIDNDGDFDYFAGSISPTFGEIIYFNNEGTPDSANFVLVSENFEEIDVDSYSSPEFCDIDNDGDYDLFVGCEDGTVWFYRNTGTPEEYDFQYVTDNYFNIYTGEVSVPRFVDIDADGDCDLFLANESAGFTDEFEGDIAFFENTGDAYRANFNFITGNYLFMDMSATSSPAVVDIDDDGLLELLVGIVGGDVVLFENGGTQTDPSYYFTDSSYLNLELTYQPVMSFGDLDADGDLDMAVSLAFYNDASIQIGLNGGSTTHPYFDDWTIIFSNQDNFHGGISLCDIDGDEDLDLFFGDGLNHLYYWENTGEIYDPRFEPVSNNYLNQPPGIYNLYPCFNDIDHDGDFDLVMGHSAGSLYPNYIILWLNIGTVYEANFIIEDTLFSFEPNEIGCLSPYLADIDNDGDDDLFVGESGGAMLFYRNMEYNLVDGRRSTVDRSFALYPNYPNPFNTSTTIPFTLDRQLPVKIVVYNQLGQIVWDLGFRIWDSGENKVVWDAEGCASGVYLVWLTVDGGQSMAKPVILLK